jgi:ADP-ribose pyrophosphatase YjhB (NUDIX family)
MKYCTECGHANTRQWIAQDQRMRYVCTSCRTTHYENPRVIVGCLVFWRDKLLLCRRAQNPALGQWIVPSGFLECGETLEEGAVRETFEEAGIALDPNRLELSSILNMPAISQIFVCFRIDLMDEPSIRPGPESLEVAFLSEVAIPEEQIAWSESMGGKPQRCFEEHRSGEFSIQLASLGADHGEGFKLREYKIRSVTSRGSNGFCNGT